MGVLAEMIMRTYYESQSKTTYLLGEVRQGPAARAGGSPAIEANTAPER